MSHEATDFGRTALEFVDKLQGLHTKKEILGTVESALCAFGFAPVVRSYRGAAS